ncbi:kinocilin isoform X2 [Paralichthys olivaceus]|uniref:kinocilin isoform X2 n=1 Tax=Paralichthys olivaceus TaxID=8255 RepID=UPI0037517E21
MGYGWARPCSALWQAASSLVCPGSVMLMLWEASSWEQGASDFGPMFSGSCYRNCQIGFKTPAGKSITVFEWSRLEEFLILNPRPSHIDIPLRKSLVEHQPYSSFLWKLQSAPHGCQSCSGATHRNAQTRRTSSDLPDVLSRRKQKQSPSDQDLP